MLTIEDLVLRHGHVALQNPLSKPISQPWPNTTPICRWNALKRYNYLYFPNTVTSPDTTLVVPSTSLIFI